jgi:O-antigen/teichoic acid export membrane protein
MTTQKVETGVKKGEESLKNKTAKGLFWGGMSNALQQVLGAAFGIVLARKLSREDYGLVGMLTIFSLIANSLQESGFTSAIANIKDIRHRDYNAVFWFSTLVGCTLYPILYLCAPFIAQFYGKPELCSLARLFFVCIPIASLGTVQSAYLFRNLMVRERSIAMLSGLVISGICGVAMACNGMAYMGIAAQQIIYVLVCTVVCWYLSPWRPKWGFTLEPIRNMFGYSSKLLITNIINITNNNLMTLILGTRYPSDIVGDYTQANKWVYMGHSLITGMVTGVTQPVMSSTTNEAERQVRIFRKMMQFTAFISFPAMFGLAYIAPEFILITIGAKWLPCIPIFRVLCISGAFIPLSALYYNTILSKKHSNVYMWNITCLCITELAAMYGLREQGFLVMISVYAGINILWMFVWHTFTARYVEVKLRYLLHDLLPFALTVAIAIAISTLATSGLESIYLLLPVKILLVAVLYLGTLHLFKVEIYREALQYVKDKFSRKKRTE